jgi:hypothetical protein
MRRAKPAGIGHLLALDDEGLVEEELGRILDRSAPFLCCGFCQRLISKGCAALISRIGAEIETPESFWRDSSFSSVLSISLNH